MHFFFFSRLSHTSQELIIPRGKWMKIIDNQNSMHTGDVDVTRLAFSTTGAPPESVKSC